MKKRALITGVTGQDGAYLAKFLIEQGMYLPSSSFGPEGRGVQRFCPVGRGQLSGDFDKALET